MCAESQVAKLTTVQETSFFYVYKRVVKVKQWVAMKTFPLSKQ